MPERLTVSDGEYTICRDGRMAEVEHRSGFKMRITSRGRRPSHDEIAAVRGDLREKMRREKLERR
jgi:hypothetical protein